MLVSNWRAWKKAGVARISHLGGLWDPFEFDFPVSTGERLDTRPKDHKPVIPARRGWAPTAPEEPLRCVNLDPWRGRRRA